MATDERWYFTKDQINSSPSRKCGIDAEKELQYRQQGSKLIQDMGQRLQVTQLVINTAIVYMHRFYMFHSFSRFHRNSIGPAALFLAAKVEEMPRKLEHVIKVAHYIICHHEHTNLDIQSEAYQEKAQELVMNENILLQTLGFDVAIDHPHVYVLKCFQMIRTTTELAQTSYFMATNSLHMTTMCLQYRPAVVACVCIYIVCKWSNYEIQRFTEEGKDWFCHVDPTITLELLQTLTTDFLAVLEKYPSRLKKLMTSGGPSSSSAVGEERQSRHGSSLGLGIRSNSLGSVPTPAPGQRNADTKSQPKSSSQPTPTKTVLSHREYSEKKEKERKEREKLLTLPPPSSLANTAVSVSSSQLRSPLVPPEGLRKPQPDQLRHPNAAQSQLAPRMAPLAHSVKEPSVKREVSVPVRASDRDSRTSDISDNVLKINSDKHKHIYDHRHNVDWNNLKNLDDSKDRKSDFKTLPKDHRTIDQRESRQSLNSNVNSIVDFKANAVKPEPLPVKVKEDKIDLKPDSKGQFLEDIKPASSFIFNNNDFSLRDFLNPSEMPPEDIFDTESDPKIFSDDQKIKEEEAIPEEELFSCETTHRKLLSPPIVPPSAGYSTNAAQKTNNSNTPSSKANIEVNSSSNSKSNSKHASPKTPSVSSSHTSTKSVPVVPPSSIHPSIPTPVPVNSEHTSQSKKKENNHSLNPATPVNQKSKVLNADPAVWLSSIARNDELKHSGTKVAEASPQVLPRDAISSTAPNSSNVFPSLTTQQAKLSSQKYNTPKSSQVDHPKVESTLQDRLFRQDPPESNSNAPLQLFPLSNEASAGHTKSKKHKHEHGRHKHKEKKKHKHKDKDKHRDKESKEHKKNKKHKKHKEKDKEKVKHGLVKEDSSMPLKITLKKGVYTPEPSSTTLVLDSVLSSQSKEKHSSVDVDTPGRIKLTIPKSRLQSGASGSQESSNDMPMTPKVKLKLHKESRKRDREHSSSSLPSKMARTSSNFLS